MYFNEYKYIILLIFLRIDKVCFFPINHTIMYSLNDMKCPRCGKHFNSERGLSQHYSQSCMFLNQSQSNSTSMIASSSSTNQFKSTNIMEPIFKRQKYHNDSSLMNISKKSVDNNMFNFPNSCEQKCYHYS